MTHHLVVAWLPPSSPASYPPFSFSASSVNTSVAHLQHDIQSCSLTCTCIGSRMHPAMLIDVAIPICPTHFCILIHNTRTLAAEHLEYVPGKKRWSEVQLTHDKLTCGRQMAEVAIAVPHLLRRDSMQTFQCHGWPLARAIYPVHCTSP